MFVTSDSIGESETKYREIRLAFLSMGTVGEGLQQRGGVSEGPGLLRESGATKDRCGASISAAVVTFPTPISPIKDDRFLICRIQITSS